jgi:DNA ligase (NAD+)
MPQQQDVKRKAKGTTVAGKASGGRYDYKDFKEPALALGGEAYTFPDQETYETAVVVAQSAARAYETTDQPEMTDAAFDLLLSRLASHEAAHGLTPDHGLHDTVGHSGAVGGDVTHPNPMLSLDKPGREAVEAFAAANPNAIVEPKIDGLAIRAVYRNGKLVQAVRRGDGTTGEDVTDRLVAVDGLPAELDGGGDFEVRGELYLSDEKLLEANKVRAAAGKAPFANARNGVAGMVNKQDSTYHGLTSFAAYGTDLDEDADHTESMDALTGMGFTTARSLLPESVLNAPDPMAAVQALGTERPGIGFLMDGAVLKVNTAAERRALGEGSRAPKWAVAYKYAAVEAESKVEAIEMNIGKTGRLSLRARITPVEVDGSVVEYASLHNVGWLKESGIGVGSTVSVYKANDIIPQVKIPAGTLPSEDTEKWTPPEQCPNCNAPFDKSTELWRCQSPECSVSGRISYAVSRDAGLDIEGVGGSIGDALIEAELVKDVADLFSLEQDQLTSLDLGNGRTLGEKNAVKIMAEIEKAKAQPLNRVITSLSMRFTGRTFGRRLAAEFHTMDALQAARLDQLADVEGIGENKARAIYDGLKANADVIDRLRKAGVNMGTPKAAPAEGAKAPKLAKAGKPLSVVITGSLKGSALGNLSRTGAQELIESNGGKASGSVSKTTDLLVCGEPGSSKWLKAQELGIKVVTPDEFAKMLEEGEA